MKKRQATSAPQMTSAERMNTYHSIFLLNRSFHFAVQRLDELSGLLTPRELKEMRGLTQEVQTEISSLLLDRLHSVELDDWGQFGKIRRAMEKRLRGPEGD
jgi:hypothetical protein